jgi:hypothetical protein
LFRLRIGLTCAEVLFNHDPQPQLLLPLDF